MYFTTIVLVASIDFFADHIIINAFSTGIIIVMMVAGILNLIDFLLIGALKKNRAISTIFYPFYRIYNFFSFSFIYRTLHYTFIGNKLGRRLFLLMLPYVLLLELITSEFETGKLNYIPNKGKNIGWVLESNYDELRKSQEIEFASINKLNYNNEDLSLFLRYNDNSDTESVLKKLCPSVTPFDRRSFRLTDDLSDEYKKGFDDGAGNFETIDKTKKNSYLGCVAKLFNVSLDGNRLDSADYLFYEHPNMREVGLLTYLNIDTLTSGKHEIEIVKKYAYRGERFIYRRLEIPFFKK